MPTERRHATPGRRRGGGAYRIEFALLLPLFCMLLYLSVELVRVSYLSSTVYAVTERAARRAAVTDFSDAAAMQQVRNYAVFRRSPGALMLGGAIDDRYVQIDYLALGPGAPTAAGLATTPVTPLPACPRQHMLACLADPNGAGCIRFVRARLCQPGGAAGTCGAVPFQFLLPGLASLFGAVADVSMQRATTVTPAASFAYLPGAPGAGCP